VQFSDGSTCEASLKKQDKNSHLAVFGVRRNLISESTWDEIKTAALGNSNIVAEGSRLEIHLDIQMEQDMV
jgi:serine protease Do